MCRDHDKLKNQAENKFEIPHDFFKNSYCLKLLKEVFGDNYMTHRENFEWHKRFSEDREFVEEDERSCRCLSSRTGYAHRLCSILLASSRLSEYLNENKQ
ncbi:hypothetical protein TNCV_4090191 [Trichonephila clavipes]|uniref:Uncharacterized protein n=1 Tax=Trichonephila clavipes TaxID=2585209 RepID=A0A8X6S3Q0_TRICX|nr:hypothetical protein TNCV_4090191 [Trichonephila clavipes]